MDFCNLKNFMDHLTSWRIPGNSISVTLGGEEVFRYMSGYSDLENKIPMKENLLFSIYSCSKVATVTAALQLYEKGYFLLDDPLYSFIPEFRDMYVRTDAGELVPAKNKITLRHLFTMTAGFTYNMQTDSFKKAREVTGGKMDTLTVIKHVAAEPLSFEPGERFQYSICHDVLAAVVEVISGKKFRDYVKENIFEPLEMKDSCYHNENVTDRLCNLYQFQNTKETDLVKLQSGAESSDKGGKIIKVDKCKNSHVLGVEYDSGGAGITTSVEDYSKLTAALSLGGISKKGERILSSGTVDLLRTNQLSEKQRETFIWPQLKGYGYGLGVRTMIDKAVGGTTGNLGEFGWGGAAGASVLVDPDINLSVFYTQHMHNPQEEYYQPRLRNVVYSCVNS